MAADLGIFKTDVNVIEDCDTELKTIQGCDALTRLISALKYYSKFDIINNENDQNIFINFMINVYPNFSMIIYI